VRGLVGIAGFPCRTRITFVALTARLVARGLSSSTNVMAEPVIV